MTPKALKAVAGHLLFWLIIMLTYAISEWGYRDNFAQAMLFEMTYLPVRLTAVYVNWFILMPRLLYRQKITAYLTVLFLFLLILTIAQRFFTIYWAYPVFFPEWSVNPPQAMVFFRIVQTLVLIISPLAFSIGIKLFIDWYHQRNQARQLAQEKVEAELKYLRSQINPHFLFNTLNNLYGLSLEKSDKVPKLLLKLSDLLSFSLYESSVRQIPVSKELQLIRDFIALEKERYEDRVSIHWQVNDATLGDSQIAPLLLMPLVENAFKHGVREESEHATVSISLQREGSTLVFKVINTMPSPGGEVFSEEGIGLTNLQRRLEILYPGAYRLDAKPVKDHFVATLKLNLYD